jgi:hypothetical protein
LYWMYKSINKHMYIVYHRLMKSIPLIGLWMLGGDDLYCENNPCNNG